jgi:biopolymer transport protein TolR
MVTAPLLTVSVPVEMPKTQAEQTTTESDPLWVTVTANGDVYLQQTLVPREELADRMRALAREGYDRRIYVRGDTNAPYGVVLDAMSRLSHAGFRKLELVSDPMGPSGGARGGQ